MYEEAFTVAGLGNPGRSYEKTRHNLGFMVMDLLAKLKNFEFSKKKFEGLYSQCEISGKPVFLLKPQTFMNLSGRSVRALNSFYKIKPENTLIVCDDFSLPVGTVRIRQGGSDGGHNGLTSVIGELGTKNFIRMRIGAGPLPPHFSSIDFVLSDFSQDEMKTLEKIVIPKACESIQYFFDNGLERTMNFYNKNFCAEQNDGDKSKQQKED